MCDHLETETESISLNLHSHLDMQPQPFQVATTLLLGHVVGHRTHYVVGHRTHSTTCIHKLLLCKRLPQNVWKANHQNVSLKIWHCMRIDRQHLCSEAILPLSAAACLRRHSFSRITGLSSSLTPFTVSWVWQRRKYLSLSSCFSMRTRMSVNRRAYSSVGVGKRRQK